eukprot:1186699-Prorocentrum_minimum.AAC.5
MYNLDVSVQGLEDISTKLRVHSGGTLHLSVRSKASSSGISLDAVDRNTCCHHVPCRVRIGSRRTAPACLQIFVLEASVYGNTCVVVVAAAALPCVCEVQGCGHLARAERGCQLWVVGRLGTLLKGAAKGRWYESWESGRATPA